MTRDKRWKKRATVQQEDGRFICNFCEVLFDGPGVGRKFCGVPCKRDFRIHYDGDYLRHLLRKRDGTCCRTCGIDVEKFRKEQRRRIKRASKSEREAILEELTSAGWPRDYNRSWWEAAHIKDLAFGGDGSLDNFKVLCVPCHKAETKALKERIARERPPELSEREFDLLASLADEEWKTLQSLGGVRHSFHSDAMKKLIKQGFAEDLQDFGRRRKYRRTEKGGRRVQEGFSGSEDDHQEAAGQAD